MIWSRRMSFEAWDVGVFYRKSWGYCVVGSGIMTGTWDCTSERFKDSGSLRHKLLGIFVGT